MSMNLLSHNDTETRDNAGIWAKIETIAEHGMVFINEDTVREVARILENAPLTNGENVSAYPLEADDCMASFVPGVGPSLLGEDTFRSVRTLLEQDANGTQAVAMFDLIVELGLQISLSGKEFAEAHLKAVNWPADEVEIRRSSCNLHGMLSILGIEYNPAGEVGEVDLDTFAQAVNDNAVFTDIPDRLQAFVECARRKNHNKVYWC